MLIFPAIDLYEGKAVRLYQGDYARMTVYSNDPPALGEAFLRSGADHIHLVDLEGARSGLTPNLKTVCAIRERTGAFCEIGGGIRSMDTVDRYLDAGLDRVILGTAAVRDPAFLDAVRAEQAVISVGRNNSYGHPSRQVLARLQSRGMEIYRTDRNGTVEVRVNAP